MKGTPLVGPQAALPLAGDPSAFRLASRERPTARVSGEGTVLAPGLEIPVMCEPPGGPKAPRSATSRHGPFGRIYSDRRIALRLTPVPLVAEYGPLTQGARGALSRLTSPVR